jgi:hypothetical protein
MASRLDDFVAAVKVVLDAGSCTVEHYTDRLALTEHHSPRRCVWITEGGDLGAASRTGAYLTPAGKRFTASALRAEQVDVYLYAEDREVTEQLLDNVVCAISQTLETLTWRGYEWLTQIEGEAAHINRVECARIGFTLPLPVPDYVQALPTPNYVRDAGDTLTVVASVDEQGALEHDPDTWPDDGGD